MHVLVAFAYSIIIWFSVLVYCTFSGIAILGIIVCAPLIVSASMVIILTVSFIPYVLAWAWRLLKNRLGV